MILVLAVGPSVEQKAIALLVPLIVIILVARGAALLARRLGQPAVVGEIMAGLILGPSLFGHLPVVHDVWKWIFFPQLRGLPGLADVFTMLAQLGLIFLLFMIGLEFDFSHLKTNRGSSLLISVTGVVLPFLLGVSLALVMFGHLGAFAHNNGDPAQPLDSAKRVGFALFMGTAMSITAIPILGRIMMEMNVTRTRLGAVTITAAAADDATGWILLATVSAMVSSHFSPTGTLAMLAETVVFLVVMVLLVRPMLLRWGRWVLRINNGKIGINSLAVLIAIIFAAALITSLIGIFAIFGAFIAGSLFSAEEKFRKAINDRLRDFVTAFFLPIFFTYTGLRTDVGLVGGGTMWAFAAMVSILAITGKFGGCTLAARYSGFKMREAILIGVMMNTRALMELIVINVGKDLGVIPDSVFCMLVMMAVLTTVMTSPLMLRAMPGTEFEPLVRGSGFMSPAALRR